MEELEKEILALKIEKVIYQLFIGKVCDEIGYDKTLSILKESKEVIEKAKNETKN